MNRCSDFVDYDKALNKGLSLLNDKKKCVVGFYIIFSINTGLRISDIMNIKHKYLAEDKITIIEKKTKKQRIITLNDVVKKAYVKLVSMLNETNQNFRIMNGFFQFLCTSTNDEYNDPVSILNKCIFKYSINFPVIQEKIELIDWETILRGYFSPQ